MKGQRLRRLILLVGLGLFAWGGMAGAENRKEMTPLDVPMAGDPVMLKVGAAAPPFRLEDLAGRSLRFDGEPSPGVRLLVFWSVFCEPCKVEMPLIQELYEEHRGQGLDVLAISMDGAPMKKSVEGFVRQRNYTFPVAMDRLAADESFVAADPYGVAATPTLYLVGRDSRIAFAEMGRVSREALETAVQNALAGGPREAASAAPLPAPVGVPGAR